MGGFLRGGSSFLKGEIIKAGSGVNREIRVGVTHVSFIILHWDKTKYIYLYT